MSGDSVSTQDMLRKLAREASLLSPEAIGRVPPNWIVLIELGDQLIGYYFENIVEASYFLTQADVALQFRYHMFIVRPDDEYFKYRLIAKCPGTTYKVDETFSTLAEVIRKLPFLTFCNPIVEVTEKYPK
ncbi:MAG: hypothetical protein QXL70_03630 [Metallosphaera sp.]